MIDCVFFYINLHSTLLEAAVKIIIMEKREKRERLNKDIMKAANFN